MEKLTLLARANGDRSCYLKCRLDAATTKVIESIGKELGVEDLFWDPQIPKYEAIEKWQDAKFIISRKEKKQEIAIIYGKHAVHFFICGENIQDILEVIEKYSVWVSK